MHSSQSYGQNTVANFPIRRGDPVKWKILNTILSISLVWRHILTSSLFCWFCFDNTQLLPPIFWNLEELYFSLPEGEVRFLKSACTNSHQPKKYFMSLFAMWDGKAWISHAQPMENPQKIQNHPLLVHGPKKMCRHFRGNYGYIRVRYKTNSMPVSL